MHYDHLNAETIRMLKQWEGLVLYAYDDADGSRPRRKIMPGDKVRGTLTIGYGHTGPDVKPGMTCTEAEAEEWLRKDTAWSMRAVNDLVKVKLTHNQFGALVSFVYNVGATNFRNSTLLRKLNSGDYAAVPAELARWTKQRQNGQLVAVQGLVNRRAAEAGLWARGEFVQSAREAAPPGTSHTGTVAPDTAPLVDREAVAWGAGILSTLGSLFAGHGPVQWALGAVIVIGFTVGAYLYLSKRRAR